jgi:hypothetical protein
MLEKLLFSSLLEDHPLSSILAWTFSHPSLNSIFHLFQITCFSSIMSYVFSSILELPCLIHPVLPFFAILRCFSNPSLITLSHPSIHPDDLLNKIHPWGGLVGRQLMTVSLKSSGLYVVTVWKRIFCSQVVVVVREWKFGCNLVVITILLTILNNQPKHLGS